MGVAATAVLVMDVIMLVMMRRCMALSARRRHAHGDCPQRRSTLGRDAAGA